MTKELKEALDSEMEDAITSDDSKRIRDAVAHSIKALCDCQMKTAERVRIIATDHPVLVDDVKAIKGMVEQGKKKAAELFMQAVKWIVIGGGGAEFLRYLITNQ